MRLPRIGQAEWSLVVILVIATGIIIWAYFFWMIVEEDEVNIGPVSEVNENSYYAAQKFLEGQGIESEIILSLAVLDKMRVKDKLVGKDDTIILINGRGMLTNNRFENLWSWVESGGRFIATAQNQFFSDNEVEDQLFQKLDITAGQHVDYKYFGENKEEDENEEESAAITEEVEESADSETEINEGQETAGKENTEISVVEDKPYEKLNYIERNQYYCMHYPADEVVLDSAQANMKIIYGWINLFSLGEVEPVSFTSSNDLVAFADFRIGEGKIYVNASNRIWENPVIACLDHAHFLKTLVGDSKKVWFVINRDAPSLLNLMWKGIPLAILAFLFAILLLLWRVLVRFGPVFSDSKIERRSFSEHIKAGSEFLYRVGVHAELIERLRLDIAKMANRRVRHFDELPDQEKAKFLRGIIQGEAENISRAYFEPVDNLNRKEFTEIVKSLKNIKEKL